MSHWPQVLPAAGDKDRNPNEEDQEIEKNASDPAYTTQAWFAGLWFLTGRLVLICGSLVSAR